MFYTDIRPSTDTQKETNESTLMVGKKAKCCSTTVCSLPLQVPSLFDVCSSGLNGQLATLEMSKGLATSF